MSGVIAYDLLRGGGILSWGIGWFGKGWGSTWSHVAPVLADGRYLDARNNVIASVPAGVHIREPSTEKWIRKVRASLIVTDEEYATWEANLRARMTDGYGEADIVSFLDPFERHLPGHWICSAHAVNAQQHVSRVHWSSPALLAQGLRHAGYVPYPLPWPAHSITPNDVLLILATAGFTIGEVETR